ncbi:uncharacterized protein LOC9643891 [Selaginella moellendorffii]|nr:uncharacterized protein LOC9643891 [Selaginella moellendorffii]|eukprot:XP_002984137.2 uncharacterized protein LOC9643891 [Selaginella moellendorffii]
MAGIGICRWKCEAWPWIQGAREVQAPALPPQKRQFRPRIDVRKLLAARAPEQSLESAATRVPSTSTIQNPRATHNAAALAYLGDAVYELYVRRHFLTPPQSMDKYNACVMAVVCCEAQDSLLQEVLKGKFLTQEERDVVRWGKNVVTAHSRATKRAGSAVYSGASALETLIGFLYLRDPSRLDELMTKLGFNRDPEDLPQGQRTMAATAVNTRACSMSTEANA